MGAKDQQLASLDAEKASAGPIFVVVLALEFAHASCQIKADSDWQSVQRTACEERDQRREEQQTLQAELALVQGRPLPTDLCDVDEFGCIVALAPAGDTE